MKLESPLGSDLARLVRVWRALIDHRLKPLELTQTHWVTLHNIHQLPPDQSQIQLAKAIGIEQPSLVRTLDQLEEKGIIGPQDGAKKREVRINKQQWLEMQNQGPAPKMNAETAEQMRFEEAESDEDQTDAE